MKRIGLDHTMNGLYKVKQFYIHEILYYKIRFVTSVCGWLLSRYDVRESPSAWGILLSEKVEIQICKNINLLKQVNISGKLTSVKRVVRPSCKKITVVHIFNISMNKSTMVF